MTSIGKDFANPALVFGAGIGSDGFYAEAGGAVSGFARATVSAAGFGVPMLVCTFAVGADVTATPFQSTGWAMQPVARFGVRHSGWVQDGRGSPTPPGSTHAEGVEYDFALGVDIPLHPSREAVASGVFTLSAGPAFRENEDGSLRLSGVTLQAGLVATWPPRE